MKRENENEPLLRLIGDMENDLAEIGIGLADLRAEIAVSPDCCDYVWSRRLCLRIIQTSIKKAVDALDSIYTP